MDSPTGTGRFIASSSPKQSRSGNPLFLTCLLLPLAFLGTSYALQQPNSFPRMPQSSDFARPPLAHLDDNAGASRQGSRRAQQMLTGPEYSKPVNITLKPKEKLHVWILAGQSNMVGDNADEQEPMPAESLPIPGQAFSWSYAYNFWMDANPNVCMRGHGQDESFWVTNAAGPELAFARTLINTGLSSKIGFLPSAANGVSLFVEYAPDLVGYRLFIEGVNQAMAAIGDKAELKGMLWVQGEADALNDTGPSRAPIWGSTFQTFVETVRLDLKQHNPSLPVIMGVMSNKQSRLKYMPYIQTIRDQQWALQMPNLMKVDMNSVDFFQQWWGDQVGYIDLHASKLGQVAMGKMMALEYMKFAGSTCTLPKGAATPKAPPKLSKPPSPPKIKKKKNLKLVSAAPP